MKIPSAHCYWLFCALLFLPPVSAYASAQQIDVKTISPEPFIKVIKRTGKLEFKRTSKLSFKTSGYLASIHVDEGDSFVKGQVLAELDTYELIAEKNASYARLLQAKKDVSRIKALLAKNLSSRQALDNAKTLVETTRANHKLAQYNLEKSQLIAPFDGVVITRLSELAELQNPNTAALQITALTDNLVARVALTAEEVSLLKLKQQAQVVFSKGIYSRGAVIGKVSKIPVHSHAVSQLYTIEVYLTELNVQEVTVGQLVNVIFNIKRKSYVYRLPIAALNSIDDRGDAIITVQLSAKSNNKRYHDKSFIIKQLNNSYIDLLAQPDSLPLTFVIKGWQQIGDNEKKNNKQNSALVGNNNLKVEPVN